MNCETCVGDFSDSKRTFSSRHKRRHEWARSSVGCWDRTTWALCWAAGAVADAAAAWADWTGPWRQREMTTQQIYLSSQRLKENIRKRQSKLSTKLFSDSAPYNYLLWPNVFNTFFCDVKQRIQARWCFINSWSDGDMTWRKHSR